MFCLSISYNAYYQKLKIVVNSIGKMIGMRRNKSIITYLPSNNLIY